MLRVGLTGGIAAGKTTIARLFESLGAPVVDTDQISRDLMQPGHSAYQKTLDRFGPGLLLANATLDRHQLRQIIFSDNKQKLWLEQMLHPLIREECIRTMDQYRQRSYLILVVPLLFETGFDELVDRTVTIDCPREQQIERLVSRDGISRSLAMQMLDAQMSNNERNARADIIIENRDERDPKPDIERLHREFTAEGG
jgi:dephospho-CoA kinase